MTTNAKAAPGWHREAAHSNAGTTNSPQTRGAVQPRRLPPFAKSLRPRADRSLIVVTGRRGWELFDRGGTTNGILLPDPDPSLYRLPDLSGWADALLIDADGTLTHGEERELARALLAAGTPYIIGRWSSYARRADA